MDPCSLCNSGVHLLCPPTSTTSLFGFALLRVLTKWKLQGMVSLPDEEKVTYEIVGWSPGSSA
ncbi:hypothetical protein V7S43_017564 [Phytophthora oleae]|uniref:Uncharacterized protein n=1 Tax=Phytophthora oleae TaxID=2107226 RepID=A0ABD3ETF1_9STRA